MKQSKSYKLLKSLGLNFSEEEYGTVSFFDVIKKTFQRLKNAFLIQHGLNLFFLSPINSRLIRPKVWRWLGCKVGKDVYIGYQVLPDGSNPSLIIVEDKVHIANRCVILCHQRDLSGYFKGGDYAKLPYKREKVHLKKGCLIGTNSVVMPGVTIGEGAIVGSCSLVTKDIPPWTIAYGSPAKVVKHLEPE
ncbi:acyltransferase [Aliifodinibius sp. S!AR15-10]|uniref:acyltransferase n=1 Tax=Aliifodinibius sp. S!AR15-10 TaxID=2950437 RepID=UPI00286067D0|nr:acyltransferase [Aliifodinibius sp. S!AR15-10]MDR8390261.1 acyltransferase [Aliifodinibius sp. S!AR15-10]